MIAKGRSLVSFRGYEHRFCFGRGSVISGMFWTSVVQVEQMKKKLTVRCKSRAVFFKSVY